MESPRLDDRDFGQLLKEAHRIIDQKCKAWSDRSPGDPGMVLLELFAHLTEILIYRLNRLPEKAFIEFLKLMGTRLHAPEAARVQLHFTRRREPGKPAPKVEIPRGTRVTVGGALKGSGELPVFATVEPAVLAADAAEATAVAFHCDLVSREALVKKGTGLAGLSGRVRRPPIVAPTGTPGDLVVEVETAADEVVPAESRAEFEGKVWRRWREVEDFTEVGTDPYVFVADRVTGTITFAPSLRRRGADGRLADEERALAAVPGKGREIRVSYWRGGGPAGNVIAGALTTAQPALPAGVTVTNPAAATGGRAAESLANALVRGPQELHALRRAVTARDFELLALRNGSVARAKALPRIDVWAHASHGEVEVLLVPHIPEPERPAGRVTAAAIAERATEQARTRILEGLAEQVPLGTRVVVQWARQKTVAVKTTVLAKRDADAEQVRARVLNRVHEMINPLPSAGNPSGWEFGRPLRDSQVIGAVLSVPGVLDVRPVRLVLEEAPDRDVTALAADHRQARTFYASAAGAVFRSLDDGLGWELSKRFESSTTDHVRAHPERAGMVAVVARRAAAADESDVHVSADCGETWPDELAKPIAARVDDLGWASDRDGKPLLWLATDKGLFRVEVVAREMRTLTVAVDPGDQALGFRAVVAFKAHGRSYLAAAAVDGNGVFLSDDGGADRSFQFLGPREKAVRVLAVQTIGPRVFLWAGLEALHEGDPGSGCMYCEIPAPPQKPTDWRSVERGWNAGTCYALAFQDSRVFAASFRGGVVWTDAGADDPFWTSTELTAGLPIHEGRKAPDRLDAMALAPDGGFLLAGGPRGIHRAENFPGEGRVFEECSSRVFEREPVTIPSTWLFCSGEHDIQVERQP